MIQVGVISDTHGLVRPQARAALAGSELILHAGDIGCAEVIEALRGIAPVTGIRGNVDRGEWAQSFAETVTIEVHGRRIHMLHDLNELDETVIDDGVHAVISGHSHRPAVFRRRNVLFFNPGSAGPRRFKLPVCVGRLHLDDGAIEAEVVELEI